MDNVVFLLSKDCMPLESLPVYGNQYWRGKTPNIDALAEKGTVYYRHYCVGGSTAMSLTGMLSGHYCHEFKSRKVYADVETGEFPSIYDFFQENEYECHLIWDWAWSKNAYGKIGLFGDESKVAIHCLSIATNSGIGKSNEFELLVDDEEEAEKTKREIYEVLDSIDLSKKQFIWLHLPHVIKGRRCYSEDMDVFDEIVGYVRKLVGDDSIILTTDHGHMNMHKGLIGYGFHVYEPIMNIPLITPRFDGNSEVHYVTGNLDIFHALCYREPLPKRDYVICDTQYYWQPKRVIAFVEDRYKYIFNKIDSSEELYDIKYDPLENYNILVDSFYDKDRKKTLFFDEYFFYPYKEEAMKKLEWFRTLKQNMYMEQSKKSKVYQTVIKYAPFVRTIREALRTK